MKAWQSPTLLTWKLLVMAVIKEVDERKQTALYLLRALDPSRIYDVPATDHILILSVGETDVVFLGQIFQF